MANKRATAPALWEEPGKILPFDSLRRQIDSLFADFGQNLGMSAALGSLGSFDFSPSTELHDGDKEVTVRIELPGVESKDVDISVSERTVEISGEKKSETERKNGDRYRSERSFGSFSRSFTLPFMINADKVDARFDKGVLTVKIPKPAEAQSHGRKVPIHG